MTYYGIGLYTYWHLLSKSYNKCLIEEYFPETTFDSLQERVNNPTEIKFALAFLILEATIIFITKQRSNAR